MQPKRNRSLRVSQRSDSSEEGIHVLSGSSKRRIKDVMENYTEQKYNIWILVQHFIMHFLYTVWYNRGTLILK